MHILLIPAWYKNPSNPIEGVFFEEQARALQKRGHKVGVLVPSYIPYNSSLKNDYIAYNDNGIFTIHQKVKAISKRSNKINNFYLLNRIYYKAYKNYVKQNEKPDIIHSHVYKYSGLLGAFINNKQQIPHVFTAHFSLWVNPNHTVLPSDVKVLKTVLNSSDKAFAVSNSLKNALLEKTVLAKDIEVLPNMINDVFFQKNKEITKSKRFRFINIGSLVAVKNQLSLVAAFAQFLKKYKVDAELFMVGGGALENKLKEKIQALGLEKNVFLTGMLNRESTKLEIQKAHVGVIASIVETFSIAGIEFMSQGLPVISTDCGGPKDYIHDFNGMIASTEEEMSEHFYRVYKDYEQYDQKKIAAYIKDNFSEMIIAEKLEQHYQKLIE